MKAYRFWYTIQFKIILSLSLLFLLINSVILLVNYHSQRNEFINTLKQAATNLNISLQNSLELAMLSGQQQQIQYLLNRIGADSHISKIFITDKEGLIRYSSQPYPVDKPLQHAELFCPICHNAALPLLTASQVFQDSSGANILRTASLIRNKPTCYSCHDRAKPANGVLYLDYSLQAYENQVAYYKKKSFLLAITSIFLLSIFSFLLFNNLIVQKIKRILKNIHSVETEDENLLKENERDEFAVINRSILQMDRRVKESMQNIRRQRDFLQNVIDSVSDGLIVIDRNFKISLANSAFCRLVNKQQSEVVGNYCHKAMSKDICGQLGFGTSCPSAKAFSLGVNSKITSASLPGQKKKLLEITACPLRNEKGEAIQSIEIVRDITEKKQLENELLQAEKMASLGRLASGIAHEINNPLATIAACTDGLLSRLTERGGAEAAENEYSPYLNRIDKCIYRCKSIIERLLAFSHLKTEKKAVVNLNEIVQETVPLISHQADGEGKFIKLKLSQVPVLVSGESTLLGQLVLNLLTNGLDACSSGDQVTVATSHENSQVVLTVADTGVGIDDSEVDRVFEPFFTTKDVGKGTGLGLSICQQIVKEHSGKIVVHSKPGEGTVFEVRLPEIEQQDETGEA